ncbi:uncharacterized protein [Hyperolius riggenbachi]|uniref:uncharacterized protein n=1 Tax=Hyperolius riggenbachi TaxID=752182 RepID=UPI0035A3A023
MGKHKGGESKSKRRDKEDRQVEQQKEEASHRSSFGTTDQSVASSQRRQDPELQHSRQDHPTDIKSSNLASSKSSSSSSALKQLQQYDNRRSQSSTEDSDHRVIPSTSFGPVMEKNQCWICGRPALPHKKVCELCHLDIAREDREVSTLIKQVVKDTVAEMSHSQSRHSPDTRSSRNSSQDDSSDEDSNIEMECFDFSLVPSFISSVRSAIEWQDEAASPKNKRRRYYKHLTKTKVSFPLMEEIKEVILEEWEKTVKKPSLKNKFQKMYPLEDRDEALIQTCPVVDASLMRIVKNVTLPIEDAVAFKDVLDRQIDQDLKRSYLASGETSRAAIALTSVAKANRVWIDKVQRDIARGASMNEVTFGLNELRLSADFLGEASVDIVRSASRSMLYAVMAKRNLWLKPWSADPTSKQAWSKIPFDGKNLFGPKMDAAISRVTGGKSGLLPQDRRFSRQKFSQYRKQLASKFTESKSYRPGREYRKNWQRPQNTFQRSTKARTSSATSNAVKPF